LVLTLVWPLTALRASGAGRSFDAAHNANTHQNLTVAADPYVSADRYSKTLFGKTSPYEAGIVAINVLLQKMTATHQSVSTPTGFS